MTLPQFFIDRQTDAGIEKVGQKIVLPYDVARHAFKSMRLKKSDLMNLTCGNGRKITAETIDPAQAIVQATQIDMLPAPQIKLGLIQALAKGGRDEQAVETATEIGADEIIPWQAHRSIVQWKGSKAVKSLEKWKNIATAATEQSRRSFIPNVNEPVSSRQLETKIRDWTKEDNIVIVLHQDATDTWSGIEEKAATLAHQIESGKTEPGKTIYAVAGPEGGISEDEVKQFIDAGALACVIGSNILRASTAGSVALALLSKAVGRYE